MKLIVLSKKNLELAKQEVLSLAKPSKYEIYDNLVFIPDTKIKLENRLGYSHKIYSFLFKCSIKEFNKVLEEFDWQSIYSKNFCVRLHNSKKFTEKQIAGLIWKSLGEPKVNLENPSTKFEFFFHEEVVIAALFESSVDKSYLKRKAHLRPELHPTSMHPGLIRACINLTGLTKGTILDPFCGSGGILIEAGLMGFEVMGNDIDDKQIERARKNLQYYKIKKFKLLNKDATASLHKADAIVTDLPYGIASKAGNLDELYTKFLASAKESADKMVVIFPNFIDGDILIENSGWKIKFQTNEYIHKNLIKNIYSVV